MASLKPAKVINRARLSVGSASSALSPSPPASSSRKRPRNVLEEASPAPPAAAKSSKRSRSQQRGEKRMARYVAGPSAPLMERIQRAYQHRLYLIDKRLVGDPRDPSSCEFFVLGATGNVYTVKLDTLPSCTCPDFAKGHVCKHLLFVYLRILKLSQSDPRIWQKALVSSELQDLLEKSMVSEAMLASQQVRQRFHEITGKQIEETHKVEQREVSGDCPICYEPMANEEGKEIEAVVFCRTCGNNVHRDCFQKWRKGKRGQQVTCIYCRAVWEDPSLKTKQKKKETGPGGYINLASYSEDHVTADTSLAALYPDSYLWIRSGGSSRRSRST